MAMRLTKWFIFSVVIGVLPILWTGLRLLTQGQQLTLGGLLGRGDLLLVASALAAAAIGELLNTSKQSIFKFLSGGGCTIVIMVGCLWYSDIVGYMLNGQKYDVVLVAKLSLGLYCLSFLASSGSQALAE